VHAGNTPADFDFALRPAQFFAAVIRDSSARSAPAFSCLHFPSRRRILSRRPQFTKWQRTGCWDSLPTAVIQSSFHLGSRCPSQIR